MGHTANSHQNALYNAYFIFLEYLFYSSPFVMASLHQFQSFPVLRLCLAIQPQSYPFPASAAETCYANRTQNKDSKVTSRKH